MKPLDLAGINPLSPYTIWQKGSRYYFKTDYDILYAISFDKEDLWVDEDAYWFNLSNMSNKKSPGDRKNCAHDCQNYYKLLRCQSGYLAIHVRYS